MAWMQKLFETYGKCAGVIEKPGGKLWPIAHLVKRAHVEITLDENGNKRRVEPLGHNESETLIPASEKSAGRTSGPEPHPLCEEVGYCAADFPGIDHEKHSKYLKLIKEWCESSYTHPKVEAVQKYILQKRLWSDLIEHISLPLKIENRQGKKTKVENEKIFVRWKVEIPGDRCPEVWKDDDLINAWAMFDMSKNSEKGFCMVQGENTRLSQNAPRFIRWSSDGAKLISANDFSGYTFRGRFTGSKDDYEKQACSVGFDVTQKAHNALRWLIGRQGYRNGDQVFIAWAVAGKPVPDPFADSLSLFLNSEDELSIPEKSATTEPGDVGQAFALRLNKAIAGYSSRLESRDDIVVIGLDSATPGRMAIIFYRELTGSEFLNRIQSWHEQIAWPQNFGKERHFTGAPSPRDIAEAAFGRRLDDKLRKSTVERLLPCIMDGRPIPHDLVVSCGRHAANRIGMEIWEWEKCLGIACSLFKGYHKERRYKMKLETDRHTRDYLYGRLLAIADNIEGYSLRLADEGKGRDTTAARLMQRFADRPFSTWRNIEIALGPYKSRLRASEKGAGFLRKREQTLDEVMCAFRSDDFIRDTALSGEFLLGYHCQRSAFFDPSASEKINTEQGE
ncbi:MAG: type I-C CRISPR-associated protein Cas8c/Csd1 [Thermodesulfobacteriota bacterium]